MLHRRTPRAARLVAALVSATFVLVSLTAVTDASAVRKSARTCRPRGAETIARTRTLRLYRLATGPSGEYGSPTALFVCEFARRRPVRLARFREGLSPWATHVRPNRGYIGFELAVSDLVCGKYDPTANCTSESVRSYGLRRGRLRASAPGGSEALALTSAGWLAWIASAPPATGSRTLLALDSAGRRRLDSGAIDPASLTARGATVTWRNAGVPHSARLR